MLKTPEQSPPAEPGRSIGEMIERLFDNALDYGRAELELLKARALEFAESYVRAAILFALAAAFALVGLVTLFVGIAIALARWIGPLGGAIVSTLLAATVAGLLIWLALRDLEKAK
ncbi:phage holin family protein [Sphingomonas sp. URHD0057]|uniref:phage holin family protein n=1 Tax=Sphingomonas sp. URHD0057 TaxID=1380389 RepID=UPI000687CECD|nr:phage holin family protein [Sphingomonas sp. URHD0057]